MSENQLDLVQDMIRGGPDFMALPPADMRVAYDAVGAVTPPAPDIVHETVAVGRFRIEVGTSAGADPAKAILYFHGGGYVIGSPTSHRGLVALLGQAARARTFAVDFRLAPEAPFPAASDDAIAAYRWLIGQGIAPHAIGFAGDSAGAGLALATALRARDERLPLPAALAFLSPFVDMSCSGASYADKAEEDIVATGEILRSMADSYVGANDRRTPYASPLFGDLRSMPPALIHVSSSEILLDDSLRLLHALGRANVPARLRMWRGLPHVWQLFAAVLDEGRESLEEAGLFLSRQMQAGDGQ